MRRSIVAAVAVAALVAASASAGVNVTDSTGVRQQEVNTAGAAEVYVGQSLRPTYVASVSGLTTTTVYTMSIEAPAATGIKILKWCVGYSNSTAAGVGSIALIRRTTASSGGTLVAAEAVGAGTAGSVSRLTPTDGTFTGVVRVNATLGTAGAILDQLGIQHGIIATGAGSNPFICQGYTSPGAALPTVLAGTANGVALSVAANPAGALAVGSITVWFVVEN